MADSTIATTTGDDPNETYWLPLESDPTLLTEYLRSMTISTSPRYLIDIPSIDLVDEMGIFEFHDIIAYIFLFPMEKHAQLGQVETDPERLRNLFFIKQFIHNSCGSVALLHAYLNTIPAEKLTTGGDSLMTRFYMENVGKTPDERGRAFAENAMFHQLHHDTALLGQSQVPSDEQLINVDFHFVAFVAHNGFIYELDGRRDGPINHGQTHDQDHFKRDTLNIIKEYMLLDPDNLNFSVLALCSS